MVKPLTKSVTLITGFSKTLNSLEYDSPVDDNGDLMVSESLGSTVESSLAVVMSEFSGATETVLQTQLRHWQNRNFKVCINKNRFFSYMINLLQTGNRV